MNNKIILKIISDKKTVKTFLNIDKKMRVDEKYKKINMIKCGLNVIKNDRLVVHDRNFIVNSFIPPINSKEFEKIALNVPETNNTFFESHINGLRNGPISTYFAINSECKYDCWHCSASKRKNPNELTKDECIMVIKKLLKLNVGIIGFTGGEPLLRNDLPELINVASQESTTLLFTTGYKLDYNKAILLKKNGLFAIGISIDSHDKDIHNKLRGHDMAFQYSVNALKVAKKAGLYTMAQIVVTNDMFKNNNIEKLALFLKDLSVDEMRILEPLPCGKLDNKATLLTDENREKLIEYHSYFNKNKKYPKAAVFPYFESFEQFGCGAGIQHSYVNAKGYFGPCDFMEQTYGSLLAEDEQVIWSKMHREAKSPKSSCLAKGQCDTRLPRFYSLMKGE